MTSDSSKSVIPLDTIYYDKLGSVKMHGMAREAF